MRITCTRRGNNISISVGTTYNVINETNTRYAIQNDRGIERNYCKTLFEEEVLPLEVNDMGSQVLLPEVPPTPSRVQFDNLDLNIDVEVDDYEETSRFDITISAVNTTNNFTFTKNERLKVASTSISCGIDELYGLNEVLSTITMFKRELFQNLNSLENTDINIEEDSINCGEILKEILNAIIETENEELERPLVGLYLLSTNINHASLTPEYISVLDEISVNTIETRNPNSGNRIKLWTLQVTE